MLRPGAVTRACSKVVRAVDLATGGTGTEADTVARFSTHSDPVAVVLSPRLSRSIMTSQQFHVVLDRFNGSNISVENFLGEVETSVVHGGIEKSEKNKFEARCLIVAKAKLDLNHKKVVDALEVFNALPLDLQTWVAFRDVFQQGFPPSSEGHIERLVDAIQMRPASFSEKDLSAFIMALRLQLAKWAKVLPSAGTPSLHKGMTSAEEVLPTQVYLIKAILALSVPADIRGVILKRVTDSSMATVGVEFARAVKSKSTNGALTIVQAAAYSRDKKNEKSRTVTPPQQQNTKHQQSKQTSTHSTHTQYQSRPAPQQQQQQQQQRGGQHRGRGRGSHGGNYREHPDDFQGYQGRFQGYSRGRSRGGRYTSNSHRGNRGASSSHQYGPFQAYEFASSQCQGCLSYQHTQVGCLEQPRCPFHGSRPSAHLWHQCMSHPEKVEATKAHLQRQPWYFLAVGEGVEQI